MAGLSIMRNRLFSPSNSNKKWSMKLGQGKLQDIEFMKLNIFKGKINI